MAQNYDFQSSGWPAAAPATGAEQVFGVDAGGNLAAMPLKALRTPGIFNFDPVKVPRWRKALARRKSLTGQARLGLIGGSIESGAYSSATAATLRSTSWPAILAADLTAAGIPASADSFFGDAGVINGSLSGALTTPAVSSYPVYDPRVTLGSWSVHGLSLGTETAGGTAFYSSSTTNPFIFAPTGPVDTFDVFYSGSLTAAIDAGSAAALTAATGGALGKATVAAGSLGAHTISLNVASGTGYIIGIIGYSTSSPKVSVLNMGWASSESGDWIANTGGIGPVTALQALSLDMVLIDLGGNDCAKGVANSATLSNINALIGDLLPTMDVGLINLFPQNPASSTYTSATSANQLAINQLLQSIAVANDIPLFDLTYRYGTYAQAQAHGFSYNDLHPGNIGHNDIATLYKPLFSL